MTVRPFHSMAAGLIVGALLGATVVWFCLQPRHPMSLDQLVVRLHTVSIRPDQLDGYAQWQAFLHERHADAVQTLEREHMYVEAMFRDRADPTTLYWLEVRGEQGAHVETSTDDIDIKHQQYMNRVLSPGTWSVMEPDNVLVAPFIDQAIVEHRKTSHANAQ